MNKSEIDGYITGIDDSYWQRKSEICPICNREFNPLDEDEWVFHSSGDCGGNHES